MSVIALDCPLCGLPLPQLASRLVEGTDPMKDSAKHVHIEFVGTMTCINGHAWQVEPGSNLVLQRRG